MLLEKCKYVVKEKKLSKYIIVYYYICKCYQKRKKSFRKNHVKGTKIFLKKKKTRKDQDKYKNPSEQEKEKKHQYHRDQNKISSEEEKQKRLNI